MYKKIREKVKHLFNPRKIEKIRDLRHVLLIREEIVKAFRKINPNKGLGMDSITKNYI